ncbi:hypothetical protein CAPTEDRAFT_198975 [Capitella teleta]|uniref:Uncharacterized protein n=1 Tax=Capitella teleta TaxID=283909 RepID=R7TEZ4_CAPTE|nr:hypothetical protein CAPTEDRAFT_198975 [Capitella teleta]|eukprot:ELT92304.1 hypothetical protein CAPTEDRAFT_198975 [Capitella teleta]
MANALDLLDDMDIELNLCQQAPTCLSGQFANENTDFDQTTSTFQLVNENTDFDQTTSTFSRNTTGSWFGLFDSAATLKLVRDWNQLRDICIGQVPENSEDSASSLDT